MSLKNLIKNEYEKTLKESQVLRVLAKADSKLSKYGAYLAIRNAAKVKINDSISYAKRLPERFDEYIQKKNEEKGLEKKLVIGTCTVFLLLSIGTSLIVNKNRIVKSSAKGISYVVGEATGPLENWSENGRYKKTTMKVEDLKNSAKDTQRLEGETLDELAERYVTEMLNFVESNDDDAIRFAKEKVVPIYIEFLKHGANENEFIKLAEAHAMKAIKERNYDPALILKLKEKSEKSYAALKSEMQK